MKKRIVLSLLILCFFAGIALTYRASAAEVIAGEDYNSFLNVSWQLTDDGVLTISSPRVIHGGENTSYPWKRYHAQITKVVIKPKTEWISSCAFSGLYNMEELVLPNTLKVIERDAFSGCVKLRSLELPDSVEQIGKGAFARCTALERVKLPVNSKYVTVEENTFDQCPLVELDIPDQITWIKNGAFSNCAGLKWIRLGTGLETISGCDFDAATQLEWAEIYCDAFIPLTQKKQLHSVVLGPNVANSIFTDCTALENVVLQEGLTSLRDGAFQGCTALKSIQLPSTLQYIGDRAFYGCPIETLELPHGLRRIGSSAFTGTKLRELTIPATVEKLREDALSIATLEKVMFLGDAPQIQGCPMTYAAPTGYYPAQNSTWTAEAMLSLGCSTIWESYCPNAESFAHDFSVWSCVAEPTADEPGLETRCCALCGTVEQQIIRRLESTDPPATVPTEPTEPAEPTTPATSAPTEPEQQPPTPRPEPNSSPWYLIAAAAIVVATAIFLLLGRKRAAACLVLVLLCGSVLTQAHATQQGNIQWEYDAATGTATATGEGILTRQGFSDRFGQQQMRHLVIGEGIVQIGKWGFQGSMDLESVTFPESLRVIEQSAFEQCGKLQSLEFADGLLILGARAFYACENLRQISFGSKLRSIGYDCFYYAKKITDLQLPDSLLFIGGGAFANCVELQRVSLGSGLRYMESNPFAGCESLQGIRVSRENRYFSDRDGVLMTADEKTLLQYPAGRGGEYTIPASVNRIAPSAFSYCGTLTAIHIPSTVETIGESAFYGCEVLTCVEMAEGVTEIGDSAFSGCLALRTLTIPASVKQMRAMAITGMDLRQLIFLGQRPQQLAALAYLYNLVVYYPAGDNSWDAVRDEFSTAPRWQPLCDGTHDPVTVPGKAATCLEMGTLDGVACSKCGLVFQMQQELALGDHAFSAWQRLKEPTVSETGWEERSCATCGKVESRILPVADAPVEEKDVDWGLLVLIGTGLLCGCLIGWKTHRELKREKKGK